MQRRALIIGINAYREVNPLQGCVNDTTNIRLILKQFAGFENDDIRMLVDDRASKAAIEHRLRWLVDGASPGDLLVLHFSGHGSQVRDRDEQDELSDELDEILCPWDMNWNGTYITDDALNRNLRVPEGVVLEVILDCCNSGDGSAELGFARPASRAAATSAGKPRFLQPPVDIVSRHEGDALARRRLFSTRESSRMVMWSACADVQTAADARIDDVPSGAFTFYFCKHLREAPALSRAELLERVRSSLGAAGYTQVPELAAPAALKAALPFRA